MVPAWKKFVALAALILACAGISKAQSSNRADCYITGIATATGEQITPGFDNRAQGTAIVPCTAWHLVYYASQASAVGIQIMYAPDLGGVLGPGSWTAATPVSGPTPLTSVNAAGHTSYTFSPWINVNVSTLTGAGAAIHWQLLGWRPGPSNDVAAPPISVIGSAGPSLNGTTSSDPCQSSGTQKSNSAPGTISSSTTTQIITGLAGKKIWLCSILISYSATQTTIQNSTFITGVGSTCTSVSTTTGIIQQAANVGTPIVWSPDMTIIGPSNAGDSLCIITAGTTVGQTPQILYVQQ